MNSKISLQRNKKVEMLTVVGRCVTVQWCVVK